MTELKDGKYYHTLIDSPVAERLGSGLQNLLRRFESVRGVTKNNPTNLIGFLFLCINKILF